MVIVVMRLDWAGIALGVLLLLLIFSGSVLKTHLFHKFQVLVELPCLLFPTGKGRRHELQLPTSSLPPAHCSRFPPDLLLLVSEEGFFRLFKVNLCSWSSHVLRPPGPRFSVNRSTTCIYSTPSFSACRCGRGSHTKKVLNHLSPSLSSVIFPFLGTSWKASIAAVPWWLFPMPANTFDFLNFKFQTYRKVARIYNWHAHTPYQVH